MVHFEVTRDTLEQVGDLGDVLRARHMVSHVFFLISCAAFYSLIVLHFKKRSLAMLGLLFLLLSPVIYAHSFFNTKDIPALGLWIVNMLVLRQMIISPSWAATACAAVAAALLVNVRPVGLMFPALTVIIYAVFVFVQPSRFKEMLIKTAIYGLTFCATLILTWPFLWDSPITRFLEALQNMAKFRWDGYVLFMGQPVLSTELPKSYIPIWIAFTTPLLFLGLLFVGCVTLVKNASSCWKTLFENKPLLTELMFFAMLLMPVASVILLDPVLYDGWRHFFFVYPVILFFAVTGMSELLRLCEGKPRLEGMLWGGVSVVLASTALWMFHAHPFQHIYFNALAWNKQKPLWQRMEMDYWGVSIKQGLEFVVSTDQRSKIRVSGWPIETLNFNMAMLSSKDRARVEIVSPNDPHDYFVTTWRGITRPPGSAMQVYRIVLNDSEVLSVFKY